MTKKGKVGSQKNNPPDFSDGLFEHRGLFFGGLLFLVLSLCDGSFRGLFDASSAAMFRCHGGTSF